MFFSTLLPAILLPLAGTLLGVFPFLFTSRGSFSYQRYLTASAAGIMLAASIWSLLQPAIVLCTGALSFFPPVLGFLVGIAAIAALEKALQNRLNDRRSGMLMLAVTLHNFPEGMAVGVALAGFLHTGQLSLADAMLLSLGIAVQNIPEGAIIFAPMRAKGCSRKKAFFFTALSGIVEPIGALITLWLTAFFTPLLPYILSFAAGCMIYVVADEMIPAAKESKESAEPTLVFACGFALMMLLDLALG